MTKNFESLSQEQTNFLVVLIKHMASGKYESEAQLNAYDTFSQVHFSPKEEKEEQLSIQHANETDFIYFDKTGYITLIKTTDNRLNQNGTTLKNRWAANGQAIYRFSFTPKAYYSFISPDSNQQSTNTRDSPIHIENVEKLIINADVANTGDSFNAIGNFQGANINNKSSLTNSTQTTNDSTKT